jgi:predicted N-formylglutamate amidohydrolase
MPTCCRSLERWLDRLRSMFGGYADSFRKPVDQHAGAVRREVIIVQVHHLTPVENEHLVSTLVQVSRRHDVYTAVAGCKRDQ